LLGEFVTGHLELAQLNLAKPTGANWANQAVAVERFTGVEHAKVLNSLLYTDKCCLCDSLLSLWDAGCSEAIKNR
jgi:hypothetical protein